MPGTPGKIVKRLLSLSLALALLIGVPGGVCELDEETAAEADAYFLRLFTVFYRLLNSLTLNL